MSTADLFTRLDRPEILNFIFFPRKDFREGPLNSTDYYVQVSNGVSIHCRFYTNNHNSPSVLFFHGNGEVVSDYDEVAPFYIQRGINLFVADYRGYGASGGVPTLSNIVRDAHHIFKTFRDVLHNEHYIGDALVMGRSLGSISAIELAYHYQQQLKGLIVESGFGSMLRLLGTLGFPAEFLDITDMDFPNISLIKVTKLPMLIIHGEYDMLIPVSEAEDLYTNSDAADKRLIIIDGADHNNIMWIGMEKYFSAIKEFVLKRSI